MEPTVTAEAAFVPLLGVNVPGRRQGGGMTSKFHPVRLPKRVLTPEQAAKFAALRAEIELDLASRRAPALGHRSTSRGPLLLRRWLDRRGSRQVER